VRDFVGFGQSAARDSQQQQHLRLIAGRTGGQGGAYLGHPAVRPFKARVVNHGHPITRGVNDFIVNDEQHFVEYDNDPKYILLESENTDGLTFQKYGNKCVAGWA
jgi:hypothetical protein